MRCSIGFKKIGCAVMYDWGASVESITGQMQIIVDWIRRRFGDDDTCRKVALGGVKICHEPQAVAI